MKKILIFRGGGYDGCFWEWNALIFESDLKKSVKRFLGPEEGNPLVKLADLQLVTGYKGRKVKALIEARGAFKGVREILGENDGSQRDSFLIRTEAQWEFFSKEWNAGFVRTVAKAAERPCRCDNCGKFFDPEEIYHTGYRGDGGVGVQYDDNKCSDCAYAEHEDYIAREWKTLRLATRVEAIKKARRDGSDVSIFAARRDELPVSAEYVWENQLY